jgi:hypothetical protein
MLVRAVVLLALLVRLLPAALPAQATASSAAIAALLDAAQICHAQGSATDAPSAPDMPAEKRAHDCALCPVCLTHAPLLAFSTTGPDEHAPLLRPAPAHAAPPATGPPAARFATPNPRGPPV